jgi:hypothetical protein
MQTLAVAVWFVNDGFCTGCQGCVSAHWPEGSRLGGLALTAAMTKGAVVTTPLPALATFRSDNITERRRHRP